MVLVPTFTAIVTAHAESPHRILGQLLYQTQKPEEIICLVSDYPLDDLRDDFQTVKFVERPNCEDWGHDKRAHGIELATQEYLGFFNQDDFYEPDYLETMLNKAVAAGADIVYCAWNTIPECEFALCSSTSGNFVVRSDLARAAGYESRDYTADGLFIEKLKTFHPTVKKVPRVLYHHNA